MKPIPTYWSGRHFRSRLEARWAVFFDSLGLGYEYEKEGYDLGNGIFYLPDFWLTELRFWVEIKPGRPDGTEFENAKRLTTSCGIPLYMAVEPIGHVKPWLTWREMADPAYDSGDPPPHHIAFLEEDRQDEGYLWTRCSSCDRYGIHFEGRSRRLCGCEAGGGKEGRDEVRCEELISAYGRALSENFDPPWNARKLLKPTGSLGR